MEAKMALSPLAQNAINGAVHNWKGFAAGLVVSGFVVTTWLVPAQDIPQGLVHRVLIIDQTV